MLLANRRPAATTGLPMPSPSLADQRTFSIAENFVGSVFFEVESPEQFGPQNWGQSSAGTTATCQAEAAMAIASANGEAEGRDSVSMWRDRARRLKINPRSRCLRPAGYRADVGRRWLRGCGCPWHD